MVLRQTPHQVLAGGKITVLALFDENCPIIRMKNHFWKNIKIHGRMMIPVFLGFALMAVMVLVRPYLTVTGHDRERANQRVRMKAANFNYRHELENQLSTENDSERKLLLRAEIERTRQ
jgi:hypothetical protein